MSADLLHVPDKSDRRPYHRIKFFSLCHRVQFRERTLAGSLRDFRPYSGALFLAPRDRRFRLREPFVQCLARATDPPGPRPGLWTAPQHTNVLFDILLSNLGPVFGWWAAEKLAVSAAVLIFFWGAFALVAAAVQRPPWSLLPCIALITYGWTFHLGFFNYYLSLGLSFFVSQSGGEEKAGKGLAC